MRVYGSLLCGVSLLCLSVLVSAQNSTIEHIDVRVVTVKADRISQWEGLIAERSAFRRETDYPFYHVYQRLRGPQHSYLIITPSSDIRPRPAGTPPTPRDLQNWSAALNSTINNESVMTLRVYSDANTLDLDSPAPPTELMHVRTRTAVAGRSQDFQEWLTDDLVPALRAADAGDVRNARVVLGGSPRTWVTFSFVEGWPEPIVDLDPRVLARGDSLIATQIDHFYRYRQDLSFTAN